MTFQDGEMTNSIPLLRNSERHDFKRCPLRWHWRYQEQLVPIDFSTGPLVFGSLGHLALASWYVPGKKRGIDPRETWDKITKELWDAVKVEKFVDDEIEGTWEDARLLGHLMLSNYLQHYGKDDHWQVLWVENQFKQNIPHPDDLRKKQNNNGPIVKYVGTIDLVVRNHITDKIEYIDHKFMKTIEVDHLYIDDQNGGYLSIGTHELRQRGIIGPKEAVRVLVYNFLRKAKPDERPRNESGQYLNKDGSVSLRQPSSYFHRERIERTVQERNRQIERIGQEALVMQRFREKKLPIFKTPTRDCKWDCSYFDLCQIHESGADVDFAKNTMFRKEDPYLEYYEGADTPKILKD